MAERAKCPACGRKIAVGQRGTFKGHGSGDMPRGYAGGMVCPGSGQKPSEPDVAEESVIRFPSGARLATGGWCECEEVNGSKPIDVRTEPCGSCGRWVRLPGGAV